MSGPVSILPKGTNFARRCIALALGQGDPGAAADVAMKMWPGSILHRAMAGNLGGASGSWGEQIDNLANINSEFVGLVSQRTILGQIADDARQVPLRVRVISSVDGASAGWVSEGGTKLVGALSLTAEAMAPLKVVSMTAATDELLKSGGAKAEKIIVKDMSRAVSRQLDIAFIDPSNAGVAGEKPASVAHNAPTVAYGASDYSNPTVLKNKVGDMFDQFDGDLLTSYWIGSPRVLARLALHDVIDVLRGPQDASMAMVPILANNNVPSEGGSPDTDILVLLDADAVVVGDDGEIEVRTSRQASVQLVDNPTQSSVTPTPTNLVSLWQCHAHGFLAERALNWKLARANACVVLTGLPRA